jgi:hypothetical protein
MRDHPALNLEWTMRSLILARAAMLVMATLVPGCGNEEAMAPAMPSLIVEDAGHNAADHFQVTETVEFEVENPCNGELIVFSGASISQITLVDTRENLDAGRSVHTEFQSRTSATGTGTESGATYTIKDIYHESFQSPSPLAAQFTFSTGGMFRVASDLAGLSFTGRFGLHGVLTPTGKFKLTREVENVVCNGRGGL